MSEQKEKHFHTCIMSRRLASCKVKYAADDCEDMRVNAECLIQESGTCDNFECNVTLKLDQYKQQLQDANGEIAKLKATNTQFRTLLLTPITADKLLEEGKVDLSGINALINRQKPTWEVCDINTILYLLEYHQRFAEAYTQYCSEKLGVINLPKHKEKVKQIETNKANQALAEAKEKEKEQEKTAKAKTPREKFIASYVKIGVPEEAAGKMADLAGLK